MARREAGDAEGAPELPAAGFRSLLRPVSAGNPLGSRINPAAALPWLAGPDWPTRCGLPVAVRCWRRLLRSR
jgi:hypothetical protein